VNQKLKTPEAEPTEAPVEQKPPKEKIDISEIIKKINNVIHQEVEEYWSCANGAYQGRHCGCEDATDHPWGAPGASPSSPIYYSNNRSHWCAPIRVTPIEGGDFAAPVIKEYVPTAAPDGGHYGVVEVHHAGGVKASCYVVNKNGTCKIFRTLPKDAKIKND
jgi:hypothetical protein